MEISREFSDTLLASLNYWREYTREIGAQDIGAIDLERQNLFRAVEFGLTSPHTWAITTEIAQQTIPLINRRLYRREWIPVIERLLDRSPDHHQQERLGLLIQLGRLRRLELQRDLAMEALHTAEGMAKTLGDRLSLASALYNIGRVHLDARRYQEAEKYSLLALEILDEVDGADQGLLAWVLNTLGKVRQVDGDYDRAQEYYTRSLDIWRQLEDETGMVRTLMDMATNLRYSGYLDKAITHYRQAERLLASTENELDKILVGINLGATYFDKGEWKLAEETFRKAYSPYLRKSGELRMQTILIMNLGNVLLQVGRLTEAEAYLRTSIDMWRKLDDELNLANSLGTLGEILIARGDLEAAIPLFENALIVLKKYPTHPITLQVEETFEAKRQEAVALLKERRPVIGG